MSVIYKINRNENNFHHRNIKWTGESNSRTFSASNWNVIATMRNPVKEKELSNLPNVTLLQLDVSNPQEVMHQNEIVSLTKNLTG